MLKKIIVLAFSTLTFSTSLAGILNIQHWTNNEGTPVYFVQSNAAPMLNIVVQFVAGSTQDKQLSGLAATTVNMLTEGTAQMNSQAFSDEANKLGLSISQDASKTYATIALQCLTESPYLKQSIRLFSDAIETPAFNPTALNRVKTQMISDYYFSEQQPDSLTTKLFSKLLFANTAYANDTNGTPNSLDKINATAVKAFYQHYYKQSNAVIYMIGDINKVQAKNISNGLLSKLPNGTAYTPAPLKQKNSSTELHKEFKGNQSYIRMGKYFKAPNDMRFPLLIANYILGGGMDSLLFEKVRIRHGLSYGVSSNLDYINDKTIWTIALQTPNASREKAIKITQSVIEHFAETGPAPQQLKQAKDFLIRSMPLRFTNNGQILSAMITLHDQHLPLDYFDHFADNIRNASAANVKKAAQKFLNTNNLVLLSVGSNT